VQEIVEQTARQYDVDPLLVHSVIQVESNYNQYALSPKGAQGLMQLIPSTARRFGARNSFDVKENVEAGVKYLKYLNSLYPNDLRLTLAAYNAGEGAVAKYRNSIPPYKETEQYVYKVGQKYGSAKRAAEKKKQPVKPAAIAEKGLAEEKHLPVQQFVDAEGRLHLRTAARSEGANTP
jgi:Soluble lytic murein transglycosylase and related regulatory proteins (some contain LysM/invasin domains)